MNHTRIQSYRQSGLLTFVMRMGAGDGGSMIVFITPFDQSACVCI